MANESSFTVTGKRVDPYRGFRFEVRTLGGVTLAGFRTVSGIRSETEVVEYREGLDGGQVRKLPGISNYDNIVLERGLSVDNALQKWRDQVAVPVHAGQGLPEDQFRADLEVVLKDYSGNEVKAWHIYECWPAVYEIDSFDASSSDVVLERVELANEGHVLVRNSSSSGSLKDVLDQVAGR